MRAELVTWKLWLGGGGPGLSAQRSGRLRQEDDKVRSSQHFSQGNKGSGVGVSSV